MKHNDPQDIDLNFEELELVAEKAGELNDRVGRIENEIGTQAKALESAAMVLNAAVKGLGALRHETLESDIGTLQLSINDKTEHLAREIARFEAAVAEIDRRSEAGDEQLGAALRDIALGLRSSFDAKSAEVAEWSARVEREIAAHSVALAAIPPVLKGADAKQLNPRGEWEAGMIVNALDVVSYNGSSYISNVDGNTDKPSRSDRYTVLAKRSGNGAGGATDFGSLTGTIAPSQLVPGSTTYAVGDVLYAGTTGALSKLGAGSSGQLLSTQGAGAAPIWVTATGGAGDMNGPASATDNAVVRFDGTGGKTVQNSTVTISDTGDITAAGKLFTADGTNAAPAIAIASSTGTGLYLDAANTLGVATGGNGAVTFSTASGVANVTGHGVRSLTLAGGSSGASLVLGQGTTAANATIVPKGTGSIGLATASATLYGKVATALATATSPATIAGASFDATYATFGGVTSASASTFGIGVTSGGTSGTNLLSLAAGSDWLDINYYGLNHKFFGIGAEKARLTSTGNLLIGTTTDITGTGGLHVAGTSTATAVGAGGGGAFRVGTNVNLSGNSGGASYFGGDVITSVGNFKGNIYLGGNSDATLYRSAANTATVNNNFTVGGTLGVGGAATFAGAVAIGNTTSVSVAAASTHKVAILIGGVQYYLLASNV